MCSHQSPFPKAPRLRWLCARLSLCSPAALCGGCLPPCLPLIMCAGFIFSSNLFQQMQSGCAHRWAECSAAARVMEPGFIVRLTGMTHQHPRGRCTRALGWDTRYSRDQPHPHVTATLASLAAWNVPACSCLVLFINLGLCSPCQGPLAKGVWERIRPQCPHPETAFQRLLLKTQVVAHFSFLI